MTDVKPERLNFRGETQAEARQQLVNALKASKSWLTGYAEAYIDDFLEMGGASAVLCQVCQLPHVVGGVAGDPQKHCACARLVLRRSPEAQTAKPLFCPACEQVGALPILYNSTIDPLFGGPSYTANDLEGVHCPHCDEIFISMEQARRNDVRYNQARAAAAAANAQSDKA